MKKVIVLSVLFLFGLSLSAQEVLYKPVIIHQCESSYPFIRRFVNDADSSYYNFGSDTIALPKLGEYTLHIEKFAYQINIDSYGLTTDTFYAPKFNYLHWVSNPPKSELWYCNEIANGKLTDYYYNGNIRIEGNFVDGNVSDTMCTYFNTGELDELIVIKNNKETKTTFYTNGNIRSLTSYDKGWNKEYYESGQLKSKSKYKSYSYLNNYLEFDDEKTKKKWALQSHFYVKTLEKHENGKVKTRKKNNRIVSFLDDGTLITKVKGGGFVYSFLQVYLFDFRYKCNLYDSKGNKTVKIIYYASTNGLSYFTNNSISTSIGATFKNIFLYKNGKKFQKMVFESYYEKEMLKKLIILYEIEGGNWVKKEILTQSNVYQILSEYLNVELDVIEIIKK